MVTMIPFAGTADPEAYLDWELAVEQKFYSHLVPAGHRVRLATSEFTSLLCFGEFRFGQEAWLDHSFYPSPLLPRMVQQLW